MMRRANTPNTRRFHVGRETDSCGAALMEESHPQPRGFEHRLLWRARIRFGATSRSTECPAGTMGESCSQSPPPSAHRLVNVLRKLRKQRFVSSYPRLRKTHGVGLTVSSVVPSSRPRHKSVRCAGQAHQRESEGITSNRRAVINRLGWAKKSARLTGRLSALLSCARGDSRRPPLRAAGLEQASG